MQRPQPTTQDTPSAAVTLTDRQARDSALMSDPSTWPVLHLPVVRKWDYQPRHNGIVNAIAALDGRCEIIIGNIWDSKQDWENADRMLYPSFEACVLDGWRID